MSDKKPQILGLTVVLSSNEAHSNNFEENLGIDTIALNYGGFKGQCRLTYLYCAKSDSWVMFSMINGKVRASKAGSHGAANLYRMIAKLGKEIAQRKSRFPYISGVHTLNLSTKGELEVLANWFNLQNGDIETATNISQLCADGDALQEEMRAILHNDTLLTGTGTVVMDFSEPKVQWDYSSAFTYDLEPNLDKSMFSPGMAANPHSEIHKRIEIKLTKKFTRSRKTSINVDNKRMIASAMFDTVSLEEAW